MVPTPERLKLFDMTSPIKWDDYRIMVIFPEEMERWTEVAKPFDNTVILKLSFFYFNFTKRPFTDILKLELFNVYYIFFKISLHTLFLF